MTYTFRCIFIMKVMHPFACYLNYAQDGYLDKVTWKHCTKIEHSTYPELAPR